MKNTEHSIVRDILLFCVLPLAALLAMIGFVGGIQALLTVAGALLGLFAAIGTIAGIVVCSLLAA